MSLIRGNALTIPLADNSVDLIVTSPPYFALRSYTDDGEHYNGQLGSEATPAAFIDALVSVTRECVRVLKPSGSLFVNLGDKYSGVNANENRHHTLPLTGLGKPLTATAANEKAADHRPDWGGIRTKSLMGLPWRYALACIDQLGLILRAEIIWSKPNGLPESVQDRVRRSHEQWFHFTLEPRYYSAVDEIREEYRDAGFVKNGHHQVTNNNQAASSTGYDRTEPMEANPLGKLPGSVWQIPTEPLQVPDHLPQHFAAFPSEWPRRIILGWSPSGICCECGEGRRPVVETARIGVTQQARKVVASGARATTGGGYAVEGGDTWERTDATITGESCACPTPTAPTRPAVVLDPFVGTGTVCGVANALGRHGVGLDLSADYLKLARWRCNDPDLRAKALGVEKPPPVIPGQERLFA